MSVEIEAEVSLRRLGFARSYLDRVLEKTLRYMPPGFESGEEHEVVFGFRGKAKMAIIFSVIDQGTEDECEIFQVLPGEVMSVAMGAGWDDPENDDDLILH